LADVGSSRNSEIK
jgi:hypothetical protein